MVRVMKDLNEKIEQKRNDLIILNRTKDRSSKEVLSISQELDQLIVDYQKLTYKVGGF